MKKTLTLFAVLLAFVSITSTVEARNRHHTPTPVPPVVTPPSTGEVRLTAYTTGYGWPDNSPAGNGTYISGVAGNAGGTGTYSDPITLAVGYVGNTPDFPINTLFYIPNLHKYFKVGDTCAACHATPKGVQVWVDQWVGGNGSNNSGVLSCEDTITGNHLIIENPASTYPVNPGAIYTNSCSQQFGDVI